MLVKILGLCVFVGLVLVLLIVCMVVMERESLTRESFSSFECGFDSFKSARVPFSLHFFMITIIFLVFDLEVLLMMPFVFFNGFMSGQLILVGVGFFVVLVMGLVHEINEGSLEWS